MKANGTDFNPTKLYLLKQFSETKFALPPKVGQPPVQDWLEESYKKYIIFSKIFRECYIYYH